MSDIISGSHRLIDPYNRHLNYLRVSLTDRCNLRCVYCMPDGSLPQKLAHDQILSYEEILRIARVAVSLGVSKIRVTGGEPLVRRDIDDFLKALGALEGLSDIALTTNAVVLIDHLLAIRAAGIRRLNISLDTLKPEKYVRITGRDVFKKVWAGIEAALAQGFSPVKINAVALSGINDDELADMARLTFSMPIHMRFIEYMPIGESALTDRPPLLGPEILRRLQADVGPLKPIAPGPHDGPAERFGFDGAIGEVGLIRPMSHHFCGRCNRLRLTASGHLRPCLLSDRQVDLKGPLRRGCSDADIRELFLSAIRFKPSAHGLAHEHGQRHGCHHPVSGRMSAIGG